MVECISWPRKTRELHNHHFGTSEDGDRTVAGSALQA
jgi:hypothetical protein